MDLSPGVAELPSLRHFTESDFEDIYEPSDDTWLFCDALLADFSDISARQPSLALEIGPGSGAVCGYLALSFAQRHLPVPAIIACDVNPLACLATLRTAAANDISVIDVVNCDLVGAMRGRLSGIVDIMLFNPPYVPTPSDEVGIA